MKEQDQQNETMTEKIYEKPAATVVKLRMSEMVLGSCRTDNSAGPGGVACSTSLGDCSIIGS